MNLQTQNSAGQDFGSQPDMVRLLASLGGAAGTGQGGEEDEEGLQDAIELMMGQLMSKELLYEPMADLKARVGPGPSASVKNELTRFTVS